MDIQKNLLSGQVVNIIDRKKIEIIGATEVMSSTGGEIVIKLDGSYMKILGENLTILKLVPEEKFLSVSGVINGLTYMSKPSAKSFFKKVFK